VRRIAIVIATLVAATPAARAADVKAMITDAMKAAVDEMTPAFEQQSGGKLSVSWGPSGGLQRRFLDGEPADVIIIDSGKLGELVTQGKVLPAPVALTRTGIAIAVPKGAPHPDVSTADALKRALLDAKSVGYTDPAGGGVTAVHIMKMFETLGIAAQMAPKTKLAKGGQDGRVSVLVSSGQAAIGLQEISELMTNPGVDVIGMLPSELQHITIFSAGITANAAQPDAGRALVAFLAQGPALEIYKMKGLAF